LKPSITIKDRAIGALKWSASARLAAQAIAWAVTIYVVRILTPEDYGLMSMASVFLALAIIVNGVGVAPAFIQRAQVDRRLEQQVFGFLLISNVLVFLALQLSAPYLASFFGEDGLTAIIRVLAFNLLIGCISTTKSASLQRSLQLKGLSIVELISTALGSFAILIFALSGLGVWSLVYGSIIVSVIRSAGLLLIDRKWVGPIFQFGGLKKLASFGAKFIAQQIVFFFNSHIDVVVIGKFLGSQVLGTYSVGLTLSMLPVSRSIVILNQVIFPVFAKMQDDVVMAKSYFFKSIRLATLVYFPLLWGLSCVSSEFVEVVLGRNWQAAEIVLLVLPLVIPFRAVELLFGPVLNGLGHGSVALANHLTFAVVIPAAVLLGMTWGLVGVSVAIAIGLLIGTIVSYWRSLKVLESGLFDLIAALGPSAVSGAVMYSAVLGTRALLPGDFNGIARLVALVSVGAIVYLSVTLVINREALKDLLAVLRPQAR